MPEIEPVTEHHALFGKYELGRLLGCGAFAKVHYARNLQTGQSVAIKIISKKKINGANLEANVKREISIMSRLHHPNIVKRHEVLATKSKIYFVIEFVKGGELFAKISKGRFGEDLSRKYFQQLISAVGYCHSRGVFHRDLKPENLLLDENANLKVSDFGLSAVTEHIGPDGLLHTLCGTPAYVAPEILLKKGYDGAKVDVWSCGVILFVLAAGYLPFNDPNLMVMYKKIYKGEFRCPRWFSADLKRFMSRLLDTNPETRITVDEIIRDPWFRKGGCIEINFYDEEIGSGSGSRPKTHETEKMTDLNAFDIISFSSGLDLSGLLDQSYNATEDDDTVVTAESPEKIMEKVGELAKAERLVVRKKKECGLELEGQNGNLKIGFEVYRLTEELVMVEAKRIGGQAVAFRGFWKNKLKPLLCDGGSTPSSQVAESSHVAGD